MKNNIFIGGCCDKCGRERRFCVCVQKIIVNPKKKKLKKSERFTIVRPEMFPLNFIRHETGWSIDEICERFEKWKTKLEKLEK